MQSTSYISTDSFHLPRLSWKTHKFCSFLSPKTRHSKSKTLIFSHSLSTSTPYEDISNKEVKVSSLLPIEFQKGTKVSRYFWDGTNLQLVSDDGDSLKWVSLDDGFDRLNKFCRDAIRSFFLPNKVQGNYIEYVKWKFLHRVFSSALQVLATQAMFRAMGFGFSRSLPSAAALNWVLKDGLGRLSKCIYTSCLASAFDTELKRVRFSTSVMFSLSIGVELLTPFCPRYFLLLATVANIAKQISLACYISTRTAVHRSFAVADNLGEFSAKAQIQTVCFDSLGLILASLLNILFKNNQRLQAGLPLLVYPVFSALDLYGIYQGLQHVHLQTVTKDRLEIILDTWLELGSFPSPSKVSKEEGISFPWRKGLVVLIPRKQYPSSQCKQCILWKAKNHTSYAWRLQEKVSQENLKKVFSLVYIQTQAQRTLSWECCRHAIFGKWLLRKRRTWWKLMTFRNRYGLNWLRKVKDVLQRRRICWRKLRSLDGFLRIFYLVHKNRFDIGSWIAKLRIQMLSLGKDF